MNLKNYTSTVPAITTISNIEALLISAGASAIAKEVRGGVITAVMFQLQCGNSPRTIRLPANVEAVQDYLWTEFVHDSRRCRRTKEDFKAQAERTAWKIMHDWAQVQISLVKLKQADAMQVFLPYIWDGQLRQTYYEYLKQGSFKMLPAPSEPIT